MNVENIFLGFSKENTQTPISEKFVRVSKNKFFQNIRIMFIELIGLKVKIVFS
jgi:hypothetical protein